MFLPEVSTSNPPLKLDCHFIRTGKCHTDFDSQAPQAICHALVELGSPHKGHLTLDSIATRKERHVAVQDRRRVDVISHAVDVY